jgi:XRE family transcriptional regulator, regulator of sulfur utilization
VSQNESDRASLSELGRRVRDERIRRGLSLQQLSTQSRVSTSMISAIERGAKAATVIVLDRIATGLNTSLSRLLEKERAARVILLRYDRQKVAKAPEGWERRILSPVRPGVEFELMRTTLGPSVDAGVFLPHARGAREYVAVEKGTLLLTLDGEPHTLEAGDSIYYDGDCMHGFANPGRVPCVYYLAMDVSGDMAGTTHRLAPPTAPPASESGSSRHSGPGTPHDVAGEACVPPVPGGPGRQIP